MSSAGTGIPFGRYRLVERIGEGGMAQVWKGVLPGAHDFQRVVVIKRILPELTTDPEFTRMFTREALLSARLNHPNIVQVFEFSTVDEQLFLAMEFVDGVNVHELLRAYRSKEPMPVGFAAYVVHEVCRALAYAHKLTDDEGRPLQLIHRDVTPSNVMISRDGVVKLLDFGIAKALGIATTDDKTRTGSLKGKMGYLSPELVDGVVDIDQRSDIFAAGIVLYELLTGRRLFKGPDELRTLALIRACEVAPPSTLRPNLPPELDAICLKALARDRADRYADASAMMADLSDVVHHLGWDQANAERFIATARIETAKEALWSRGGDVSPAATAPEISVAAPSHVRWIVAAVLIIGAAAAFAFRPLRKPTAPPIATTAPLIAPVAAPVPLPVAPPVVVVPPAPVVHAHTPAKVAHHPTHTTPRIKDVSRGELVNPFDK